MNDKLNLYSSIRSLPAKAPSQAFLVQFLRDYGLSKKDFGLFAGVDQRTVGGWTADPAKSYYRETPSLLWRVIWRVEGLLTMVPAGRPKIRCAYIPEPSLSRLTPRRIRELLEYLNLTQKRFAELSGYSLRQVQSWLTEESGTDYNAPPRMLWVLVDEIDNLLEQTHARAIRAEEEEWRQLKPSS